jgi:hypothetical protein
MNKEQVISRGSLVRLSETAKLSIAVDSVDEFLGVVLEQVDFYDVTGIRDPKPKCYSVFLGIGMTETFYHEDLEVVHEEKNDSC